MFTLFQRATAPKHDFDTPRRRAANAVSHWVGTHKIDPGKLFITEEKAMENVCERIAEISRVTRLAPDLEAHRNKSGSVTITDNNIGVVFVIRAYDATRRRK